MEKKNIIEKENSEERDAKKIAQFDNSIEVSNIYSENIVFQNPKGGHGFAAEKGNNLIDLLKFKEAEIIGGDNAKDGPDRLVNGIEIQSKYCSSGTKCISACFKNNEFRYISKDGNFMKVEVPSDMYPDAVKAMEKRISKGHLPGIDDINKAKDIVRKGNITYSQAKNIAKFGTVESLTYDSINGVTFSIKTVGISVAVNFALQVWNGKSFEEAMEQSLKVDFNVFRSSLFTNVVTAQLGRTGIEKMLRPLSDKLVKQIGHKNSAYIANIISGKKIHGIAASKHVSKILRSNMISISLTSLIQMRKDIKNVLNNRISYIQFLKNFLNKTVGVSGGVTGWATGAWLGTIIFPPLGGLIGGIFGAVALENMFLKGSKAVIDVFIDDDCKVIIEYIKKAFELVIEDYLLVPKEIDMLIINFKKEFNEDVLMDIYSSENRDEYSYKLVERYSVEIVKNRRRINFLIKKREV